MANKTTDSWDNFCGANFLKTDHVKNEQDAFVVVSVEIFTDDEGNSKPRLTLQNLSGSYLFDLNVTNSNFCKNAGVITPKQLMGKKIYFKKIFVTSPKSKREVESLRISKVE